MRRTLLFDLDDTLLDFHKAEKNAIQKTLAMMDAPHDDVVAARYSQINDSQWKLLEQGKLTREQVLSRRFELLYEELGLSRSVSETKRLYETLLAQGYDLLDGALDTLQALYKDNDLYIVSNGTAHIQNSRIMGAGIAPYFQKIFISQRMGVNKPNKAFFNRCFAEMPAGAKERAIIIGDSLTSDIQGGRNTGIITCWFNPHGKQARTDIPADHEIRALAELPSLLEEIM